MTQTMHRARFAAGCLALSLSLFLSCFAQPAAAQPEEKSYAPFSRPRAEADSHSGVVDFTTQEEAYLRKKKKITMCVDPDWMPLEKIENGVHVGMTADYFDLFRRKIPIPIVLVPTKSWVESIAFAKARKCDIFSLAMPTPERKTYMNFTRPYLDIPLVMAARKDRPFVDDITSLTGVRLGVVKGYAFGEILRNRYPEMNIVDVDSVGQGLRQVETGTLDGLSAPWQRWAIPFRRISRLN